MGRTHPRMHVCRMQRTASNEFLCDLPQLMAFSSSMVRNGETCYRNFSTERLGDIGSFAEQYARPPKLISGRTDLLHTLSFHELSGVHGVLALISTTCRNNSFR